jgi:putative ABC transport system permease protein
MLMRILRRARFWLAAGRHAADLSAEIEDHRARTQATLEARGLPAADAAARSRRAMGNVTLAREDAREVWIGGLLERAWRDAVYGARALRREPTFTLTALLTLTLGIATTTTVFSVVDAEIWKPLPLPDPHQLVAVRASGPGMKAVPERVSGPDFLDWRAQSRFTEYAAIAATSRRVLRRSSAESITVLSVTADFFRVLRREPNLGRAFGPEDEHGARAAILSDDGWKRLFDADPAVVGRTVSIDGEAYGIVGVTAGARLEFMTEPDLYVAIDSGAAEFRDRSLRTIDVIGRLRPAVQAGQAQAELQAIAGRIAATFPDDHLGHTVRLQDLQGYGTGYNWRPLYFFLGAATLVLILSCLNVAGLLLARALRRQREFAIRGALGGGRRALARQLLVEGALLAVPGAAAGALVSTWALGVFTTQIPEGYLERGGHIALDARVAALVVALCGVITILLALTPMFFARRIELNVMLGQGSRTAGRSPRQRRMRSVLLVGQVTMTLVLLAGAALFVTSFARLTLSPLGFDPRDRIALSIAMAGPRYAGDAGILEFSERLLERARATPGVRDAAVGSSSPLGSGPSVRFVVSDRPRPGRGDEPSALFRTVSPAYFRTLGIRQLAGREFTPADAAGAPRVAIVNETLVRRMFPDGSAVGRRLELLPGRSTWTSRPGTVVIVGVVSNVKDTGFNEVDFNNLYLAFAQAPPPVVELVVNSAIPAAGIAGALRTAAAGVDPALPVPGATTLTQSVDDALQEDRFNLLLIGFFAVAATLLAAIGIYGTMVCAVQERTREFGVRLALGAMPRAIVGSALWESARVGLAGSVLGAAITIVLARILGNALYLVPGEHEGLLYGVKTTDPIALGSAFVALVAVATLAGLVPARQAARVDPLVALRNE